MKRRIRLIAAGAICQRCGKERAVVLFHRRAWCLADVVDEVIALRAALLSGTEGKAC
jgi:hypothetical protein